MSPKMKFQQQDTQFQGKFQQRLFRTLRFAYQPFLYRIFFLLLIGILGRFVLLMNTNLIGYWVDSFCVKAECKPIPHWLNHWTANDYMGNILILCAVGFILTLLFRIGFSRLSAVAISRIYDEVTWRTSRFPLSFFDSTPAGRIITRFSSDYGNVFRLFGGPLAEFLALLFDLLVMIALITLASPFYLILVAIIVVINFWVFKRHQGGIRTERRALSLNRAPSIAHFAETAQGASSIRTYLKQNSFINKFKLLNDLFLNQRLKTFSKLMSFSYQINALTALLLLATGLVSYYLLEFHLVTVGAIGVAFTYITLSGHTVQTFFEWLAQLDEAMVGAERLDHYLHLPLEMGARLPAAAEFNTPHWTQTNPIPPLPLENQRWDQGADVLFEQVSFRYREDLPWVLKNLQLSIKASERIGIVGHTGSGKSTLIQALFYLYPVTQGSIQVGGKQPYLSSALAPTTHHLSLSDYRKLITLIPQEPILFRGTLRENLDLTKTLKDENLITSLQRVGLDDWFQSMPLKLSHRIEERGKNLSQGERQLLCMARCLLQDSPVIVLDEATASVDPQSEIIMVQATQNFFAQRTQLIIAHRLSTLEHCDQILWLHHGEIQAFDSPDRVLPQFIQRHKREVHL